MLKTQIKETSRIKRMIREGIARFGVESEEKTLMRVRRASIDTQQRVSRQAHLDEMAVAAAAVPDFDEALPPPPAPPAPPQVTKPKLNFKRPELKREDGAARRSWFGWFTSG